MPCRIAVHVIEARALPVMDRATSSTDAYVVVKLPGTEATSTTACVRKSLNPRWDETVCQRMMSDDGCVVEGSMV